MERAPLQMRTFNAVVERDSDSGFYIGYGQCVPVDPSHREPTDELRANLVRLLPCSSGTANRRWGPSSSAFRSSLPEVGTLPVRSARGVIGVPRALDFVEVRQRSLHNQFRHEDGRATTVPVHGSRDSSPTLVRLIIKDLGVTREEFLRHRWGPRQGSTPSAERTNRCLPPRRASPSNRDHLECPARGTKPPGSRASSFEPGAPGHHVAVGRYLELEPPARIVMTDG